jgi:hypothetical protein
MAPTPEMPRANKEIRGMLWSFDFEVQGSNAMPPKSENLRGQWTGKRIILMSAMTNSPVSVAFICVGRGLHAPA